MSFYPHSENRAVLHPFSLTHVRFILEAKDGLALHPANPGNTLRGAFGATFKRLVCPTPGGCRTTCGLKATCPYGRIFEPSLRWEGAERTGGEDHNKFSTGTNDEHENG